jgi:DNA-binding transcriptional LysR family regulator
MEIRHLQSFIALAEEGQFTAAARKMNIVQSGLSVTIKEMERELGVQLVNRTTRNLSLTHAGELFLEHARSSLATLNDGIQAVRSQDGVVRGRLHLGILQSLGPYVDLPAVLESFRTKYPQVEFAVRSLNTGEIPGLVRSGYVDLSFHAMISRKTWSGIRIVPFVQDSLVAICSRKHSFAKQRSVTLDAVCKETFVDLTPERALRTLVDQACASRSLTRNSVYQVSNVDSMLEFVAAGLGVAIVPEGLARVSAHSKHMHVLTFAKHDLPLPKWRVVIATRVQRRSLLQKKTTVDLFLETLADVNPSARITQRSGIKRVVFSF